ncbi:hypothetical protein [Cochlodiniinecator piscidefendens]|uniref:hypothetical protein n=1 Tax=Cochlodiniinecator piscidefendens TaxID=2715756 RepID=UPI00140DC54E|nr:hypothetical protein [Cochlodiniinecator piscidefendens]
MTVSNKTKISAALKTGFGALAFGVLFSTAAQACPDWSLSGAGINGSATDFYTQRTYGVVAGGNNSAAACGLGGVAGNYASAPDFELNYNGASNFALQISVYSDCDATLLINTPSGSWMWDDDSNGNLDPKIYLNGAASGTYDIWIGSMGGNCSANLALETF